MKRILFFYFVIMLSILASQNSFAWYGYDEKTSIGIEIGPGNTVETGREIKIYDFSTDSYHDAEVLTLDYIFSGARLEVKDLLNNERRVFYMERQ